MNVVKENLEIDQFLINCAIMEMQQIIVYDFFNYPAHVEMSFQVKWPACEEILDCTL